ncbi:potassium channel subfamily U member 1 isoform X2 [Numida meleagris]|uniref:potassium channel subfamily U member 1 isoform X2 n=1 Tax=Numida meleagris TaxID=8996 RepID=UPI000B3DDF25|nr:potassium channel subfamily U member 1 isoform X2 [Numida meleagris]XP_021230463.1 potassium channel subfamily U member 1 isoform X2 [Numida meleagris]XP_021230464.1 potassium channel subfamily U member 1 isoform X2 [Numida meleagris]XP_021230465.1 potassium channel subfamily U member 1 isoform X2 [Numida meleagris]XP_021230466.1 potassium channel subfamily U member 1 isoform X2 [Numida meleagris]
MSDKDIWWSHKRKQRSVYYIRIFSTQMEMMLSAQTSMGRVLMILVFLLNIGTLIIYFIDLAEAEQSAFSFPGGLIYVDTFFHAFFIFYFGLRFVAADDKLRFWLELNSLVDFFTVSPVSVPAFSSRNCFGLRFLRALRLLDLPRILQILRITKDDYSIKLSKLFAVFISTWLTAAGFIHLVENSGDPWIQPANSQPLTYFKCMYLVMVTMSTVGYGDIVVQTALGRTFICFFIIAGLVLFANLIPEVLEIVQSRKSYKSSYEVMSGKNFIVVCGNVTLKSVTTFLQDFLLRDKGSVCTEILFLGESLPSLELEAVFKCYSPYTTFFYGSVLNSEDLERVRMESANACLILADVCSPEPYTEDISNIMRVLSIKNHYPKTRVILQIIQSRNKVYLPNIPNWDWTMGDSIICFAELKLGFIAQSCLVPGLSTLLTSLFIGKENSETKRKHLKDKMLLGDKDYKVMTFQLSNDFADMSFIEVCRLCFVKLNLVLLGIELKFGSQGESAILINPSPQIKLRRNTMGFFIAHSFAEVIRAHFYCKACHSDIQDPEQIEKCQCGSKPHSKTFSEKLKCYGESLVLDGEPAKSRSLSALPPQRFVDGVPNALEEEGSGVSLYLTGRFHWCDAVPLRDALLSCKNQAVLYLQDHILVCVFGDANSPLIGLQDFVMPLRASNFLYHELKDIVLLGPLEYLQREWKFIQNFPKVWLFSGSALSCADLKAVNVQHCAACVILSSNTPISNNPSLVDTESILATLNVRSMEAKPNSSSLDAVFRATALGNQSEPCYKRIPITTELKFSPNAHFINQAPSSSSDIPEEDLLSPTAAPAGAIFSDSFLNSLLSMTYYNHHILALLQALVTSRTNPALEQLGEEDSRLSRSLDDVAQNPFQVRCKLALLPLSGRLLSGAAGDSFGDVYCKALDMFGILCFGLYRLMEEPNPYKNRFVIARPASDLEMLPTDLLFSIVPFNIATDDP